MAGGRRPIEVLKATGKKHLTKAETEARERSEVKPPTPKQVRAPDFLPTDLRKEFNDLSRQLVALEIFAKLDRDTLARYLIAQQIYLRATNHVEAALDAGDQKEAVNWSSVQDRYFKQCRNCANDLGLTISSRCKLVVPQREEEDVSDPMLHLMERRNA